MALEGTLRDFSFADILQLISLQRKTGVLTLKNEGNVVTISFLEGMIVGASSLSQHEEDRLGLILLKWGAFREEQLEKALRRQEETLQRLGRILIDDTIASPTLVRRALGQQILQIVYRMFRWTDGEYQFTQETDIDFDRELVEPMVADSIIMEGARMTDEWPFIDQRIPNREVVLTKSDPGRKIKSAGEDDTFDEIGFTFSESPEEAPSATGSQDRITASQAAVYELVNGRDTISEIILSSPLIEFETCKGLAELLNKGLVREARLDEVAFELSRIEELPQERPWSLGSFPWLAIPFLVLLGFSLSVMSKNPLNPGVSSGRNLWDRYVMESRSWFGVQQVATLAEISYYLNGFYPDDLGQLLEGSPVDEGSTTDPWGRPFRLVVRGDKLLVAGSDARGQPVPLLLLSRSLAWEGSDLAGSGEEGPGVILID